MSSPGTPSSPAAFHNFICFTAASTSLSSGAGSVLVNGALVTGISFIRFREKVMSILFPSPQNVFWLGGSFFRSCRGAYLWLHNISRIRRFLTQDATKTLIQAFVISKLDCGNALLSGVSTNLLRKLQRVQNMAARVITFTPRREHISPVLRSLHWLPIHRRIEFKILLLVYLCLHDIAPQYLAEMLTTHAVTRSLRSTDKQLLVVPRSKLKRHGDRSFNVVAPVLWNSLPECMKSSSSVASFKRTLKTFLFRQEYGVINWH